MTRPLDIQGHRGARALFPENTLGGFLAAHALGVQAFELDVGMTADGVLVVSHDPALNPDITRDASGVWLSHRGPTIRSLTYSELHAYDVGRIRPGSRSALLFPDQTPTDGARIPTLAAVLAALPEARFTVGVKTDPVHAVGHRRGQRRGAGDGRSVRLARSTPYPPDSPRHTVGLAYSTRNGPKLGLVVGRLDSGRICRGCRRGRGRPRLGTRSHRPYRSRRPGSPQARPARSALDGEPARRYAPADRLGRGRADLRPARSRFGGALAAAIRMPIAPAGAARARARVLNEAGRCGERDPDQHQHGDHVAHEKLPSTKLTR
jgi:hypothetical protein